MWVQSIGVRVLSWFDGVIATIFDAIGLSEVGGVFRGIIGAAISALMAPIATIKNLINNYVIETINDILNWDIPGPPGRLGSVVGIDFLPKLALAAGGITTQQAVGVGGVQAVVGEAGPELILPLRPQAVRAALAPALDGLALPGLDQVLRVLESIDRRLGGTLHVDGSDGGSTASQAQQSYSDDLLGAVGMGGI